MTLRRKLNSLIELCVIMVKNINWRGWSWPVITLKHQFKLKNGSHATFSRRLSHGSETKERLSYLRKEVKHGSDNFSASLISNELFCFQSTSRPLQIFEGPRSQPSFDLYFGHN